MGRYAQLVIGPAGSGKVKQHSAEARKASCCSDRCLFLQSTYCDTLRQHCEAIGRTVHIVNLGSVSRTHRRRLVYLTLHMQQVQTSVRPADPAAEEFQYPVSFDVRDLVTLEDVVEECQLGPNGWV